jgi:hypothetical protein
MKPDITRVMNENTGINVLSYDADGSPISASYTIRMEFDGLSNIIYLGKAQVGTLDSEPLWQIRKFGYIGTNLSSILFAGGSQSFTNIWDNRASLVYN